MDRYHKDTPMITVRRMGRIIRIIKTIRIQGIIFYKQICLVFDALQRVMVGILDYREDTISYLLLYCLVSMQPDNCAIRNVASFLSDSFTSFLSTPEARDIEC